MCTTAAMLLGVLALAERPAGDLHRERVRNARDSCLLANAESYCVNLFAGGVRRCTGGYVICHTSKDSGKMSWLYCTGIEPQPTRRLTYVYRKTCGILVDGERLFVAAFETPRFATDKYDRRPDRDLQKYLAEYSSRGSFLLLAISMPSGKIIGRHRFSEAATDDRFSPFNPANPINHLGHGPIEKTGSGVSCFGYRFAVKDGKLLAEAVVGQPDATADGDRPRRRASPSKI